MTIHDRREKTLDQGGLPLWAREAAVTCKKTFSATHGLGFRSMGATFFVKNMIGRHGISRALSSVLLLLAGCVLDLLALSSGRLRSDASSRPLTRTAPREPFLHKPG